MPIWHQHFTVLDLNQEEQQLLPQVIEDGGKGLVCRQLQVADESMDPKGKDLFKQEGLE